MGLLRKSKVYHHAGIFTTNTTKPPIRAGLSRQPLRTRPFNSSPLAKRRGCPVVFCCRSHSSLIQVISPLLKTCHLAVLDSNQSASSIQAKAPTSIGKQVFLEVCVQDQDKQNPTDIPGAASASPFPCPKSQNVAWWQDPARAVSFLARGYGYRSPVANICYCASVPPRRRHKVSVCCHHLQLPHGRERYQFGRKLLLWMGCTG